MPLLGKQLEVKESSIPGAGSGLFTKELIPKGTRITEYKGRVRTWKEAQFDSDNYYIFFVNEDHVIDAARSKKSLARYINDAQGLTKVKGLRNNAEFVCEGLKVFIVATRNIEAGGEIFVGYGKDYWKVLKQNMKA